MYGITFKFSKACVCKSSNYMKEKAARAQLFESGIVLVTQG